jgi:hypothetical protein
MTDTEHATAILHAFIPLERQDRYPGLLATGRGG